MIPLFFFFILMDEDTPVGQIRLNIDGDEAEIGYSIDLRFRGKGYGHRVLQLIEDEIAANHPYIQTLVAKVKPENIASSRLFESEGYEMKYLCYTRKISGAGYKLSRFVVLNAIFQVGFYEGRVA